MAMYCSEENLSDDENEVFFGKLSLKEVKKHILFNHRQTISCVNENLKLIDDSVRVIETHSEPEMYSERNTIAPLDYCSNSAKVSTDWDIKSSDDSFLKLEKMVTEMCMSPNKNTNDVLDNTLEVVEFILNNAPLNDNYIKEEEICNTKTEKSNNVVPELTESQIKQPNTKEVKIEDVQTENKNDDSKKCSHLEIENLYKTPFKKSCKLEKHVKNSNPEAITTPLDKAKHTKEIFKTPKYPVSSKKYLIASTKKTPSKINAYQHITSPVATYIKNCPQVPLLKDVQPKKPLPSSSSIPQFLKKTVENSVGNKENVLSLPSIAYRCAKKTKMITIPDKEKLPQSPWAKKLASSLPKPVVIKHDHREINSVKKPMLSQQEDSFANLSLHQADLSVCTQKSAVTKHL